MSAATAQIHEMRAIELVTRATDYVEKWARSEEKIGRKPVSLEKKNRAIQLSKALLAVQGVVVNDLLIDVVIESACLANDNAAGIIELPPRDPTGDSEDDDEEDD